MAPSTLRSRLSALRHRARSRYTIFGSLRHTAPVNPAFGLAQGTPIDRHYIEAFLAERASAITGRVLEVGDRTYTERYGTRVTSSDVLHVEAGSPEATIVADLAHCPQIGDARFDCVILTQTLHYLFDMPAAVSELHRILAPGGRVLCTVPGISQISRYDMERWGDRWRLTTLSARELFETSFEPGRVDVRAYGNTLSAICLLEGITSERLRPRELSAREPDYEVVVAIDAAKAGA